MYMEKPPTDTPRSLETVERAAKILDLLNENDGMTGREVSNEIGLSMSNTYYYLTTLAKNELVIKREGEYQLSLKYMDYSQKAKNKFEIFDLLTDEADKLANEINEAVQIIIEEYGWGVYVYIADVENAVPTGATIGDRKYLHCTALGKAALANLPEEYVEWVIEARGLPQVTPNTITEKQELFDELEHIRNEKVSFDDEESEPGQRCVAVPITCFNKDYVGAMSVAGPANRIKQDRFENTIPEALKSAINAIEISARHI
jgi:DNA-binding IclR family transcriptional regulator